jgi:dipeptidyl aminopeptidase/acylaminoacyl peptidase
MFTMRLAVSADGKTVVLPKPGEASLCFVGLDTGRIESVVSPPVTAWLIAMSPDGRTLALADLRGDDSHPTICIWDVAASKEITLLSLPRRVVSALAFSADSRFIAAATDAPPEGLWDEETATIQLWDTATGRQVRRWQGHESRTASLAFARDGTRLAAGLDNGSILLWNLAGDLRVPLLKNTESSNAEIERRWGLLASQDAQEARRALWELSATPQRTLLFLQGRLVPAEAPEQAHLTRLICDLDDNDFSTRESAETKLKGLGELAVPALQGALARPPSLEARRRIERLLTQLTAPGLAGDRVRAVRAVEVLEHVGTPEACHLLQKMTKGVADARLTREAKAALERLGRRAQQ